jgi:hypothetical protein
MAYTILMFFFLFLSSRFFMLVMVLFMNEGLVSPPVFSHFVGSSKLQRAHPKFHMVRNSSAILFSLLCSSNISHIAYFFRQFQFECNSVSAPLGLYPHKDHPGFRFLSKSAATYAQVSSLFPLPGVFTLT